MKKLIYFLIINSYLSCSYSQCGLTLLSKVNVCTDSCSGNVMFGLLGVAPFDYTTPDSLYVNYNGSGFIPTTDLCVGNHVFTVTDAFGCTFTTTVVIDQFDPFEAELIVSNPNSGSSCDGELSPIAITGGTEPFDVYLYDCDSNFIGQNVNSICPGDYYAVVVDSAGCFDYTDCISTAFLSAQKIDYEELKIMVTSNILQINQSYDYVKIYNLSGQIVLESLSAKPSISIAELVGGSYIIMISKGDEILSRKFLKNSF